jgi:outer membrane translocation and assembly module TamA
LGTPVGGELVLVGNIEWRRPVWGRFWMSMFADVGNLWATAEDFWWEEWNVGAGLGLQFISPIGPLRMDYARRVVRVGTEPGGQLHVSIGYAF